MKLSSIKLLFISTPCRSLGKNRKTKMMGEAQRILKRCFNLPHIKWPENYIAES